MFQIFKRVKALEEELKVLKQYMQMQAEQIDELQKLNEPPMVLGGK